MTQALTNKKPPYLLMYIVTLVYLVVTAFFEEGVAYFDPVYTTLMSSTEFYLTFSLCVVLFLTVIYIAKHYFGIRINWVFFSLVVLLFLIDVVAILSFPEWTVLIGVYHVTTPLRLRYITFWLAACMAFYVFFAIMPKSVETIRSWNFYFIGAIAISVSACVYSYVHEWNKYVSFFDPNLLLRLYDAPVSFTNNRNTYGTLLLIGLLCSFYLFSNTRKRFYFIFGIFFFLNAIMTFSKTCIICSFLFIFLFSVYEIVTTFKSHPITRSIYAFLLMAVIVFAFLINPLGLAKVGLFNKISIYISNFFDTSGGWSIDSLGMRSSIWSIILVDSFKNPIRFLFGMGNWNFSWYLGFAINGSYSYIESAHSGLLDVIGRLGFFGFIFYASLFGYFLFLFASASKRNKGASYVALFMWACTLIHGLFEDTNFLNMQAKDMMLLFMSYIPVLPSSAVSKGSEKEMRWEYEYSCSAQTCRIAPLGCSGWAKIVSVSLTLSTEIVIGLSRYFSIWRNVSVFDSAFFQLQMALIVFFVPPIVYSSLNHRNEGDKIKFWTFLSLGFLWFLSDIVLSVFVQNLISLLTLLAFGIIVMVLSFAGIDKKGIKTFFVSHLIMLVIDVVLILISKIVVNCCMVTDEIYQPYAAMCLVILDFITTFLIIVASPLHKFLIGEFDSSWWRVEDTYRFISYRYRVKYEIRLMKATQRKPILRCQK
jgi:hypothetical protein